MRLRSTLSTARFIQDAVERQAISQIQTNRELTHFENSSSLCPNSGNLPHCRSPFHCALSTSNIGSVSHPAETGLSDRKSTRLNSSHVAISYAVFCLKKKKKKKTT